jgi:DeoR/GlpR family transcriptional regulator of sugar metabolism
MQISAKKCVYFYRFCNFLPLFSIILTSLNIFMLKPERQAYILHQLDLHNKVLCSTLSEEMSVSEDTVRRDLQELSEEGRVIKVHGGALSRSFHFITEGGQPIYSLPAKRLIAKKTAELIRNGMVVLSTGGTTIHELASALPSDLQATFITSSIPAALAYSHHPSIEVIQLGDRMSKPSKMCVGGEVISKIRDIRADLCILGVNGIDAHTGMTDSDWEVVQVKKAMVEAARKTICMSIAEKLDSRQQFKVCGPERIDVMITELSSDDVRLEPYRSKGIIII